VFEGGTSLSKVFGVIDRFSEDIDLSLSPDFLKLPEVGTSRNQANRWMTRAEVACGVAVQSQIAPALETAVAGILGQRDRAWFEFITDPGTNSPVLLFHYSSTHPARFEYLKRAVKLEFGSLTDQQPVGRHPVRPWVAEVLPAAFPDWKCEVVALVVERSFWEKPTILHTEYHRPTDKPTPDRFSRHSLCRHGGAGEAPGCGQGSGPARATQPRRALEEPVFRKFMGELRPRKARHVPPRPAPRAAARAAA
jgi:hypothetical protein